MDYVAKYNMQWDYLIQNEQKNTIYNIVYCYQKYLLSIYIFLDTLVYIATNYRFISTTWPRHNLNTTSH